MSQLEYATADGYRGFVLVHAAPHCLEAARSLTPFSAKRPMQRNNFFSRGHCAYSSTPGRFVPKQENAANRLRVDSRFTTPINSADDGTASSFLIVCEGIHCLVLLCRLTCSAVRRMRRLMASCSLRANASITAMSFAVGVGLRKKSARRSQGTRKSSLSFCVEASGVVTVSIGATGSELFNGISTACKAKMGSSRPNPPLTAQQLRFTTGWRGPNLSFP